MRIIVFIFLLLFAGNNFGQITCTDSANFLKNRSYDAKQMSLAFDLYKTDEQFYDTVKLNPRRTDTILRCLLAVFKAENVKGLDTVKKYIDFFKNWDMIWPCDEYFDYSNADWIYYKSDTFINVYQPMYSMMKSNPSNSYMPDCSSYSTESLRINYEGSFQGYHKLRFTYAWMDCRAGCVFSRNWTYKIDNQCRVYSDSIYGRAFSDREWHDILQAYFLNVHNPGKSIQPVTPNPADHVLHFPVMYQNMPFEIYNIQNAVVLRGVAKDEADISTLKSGTYCIKFYDRDHIFTARFIKI